MHIIQIISSREQIYIFLCCFFFFLFITLVAFLSWRRELVASASDFEEELHRRRDIVNFHSQVLSISRMWFKSVLTSWPLLIFWKLLLGSHVDCLRASLSSKAEVFIVVILIFLSWLWNYYRLVSRHGDQLSLSLSFSFQTQFKKK